MDINIRIHTIYMIYSFMYKSHIYRYTILYIYTLPIDNNYRKKQIVFTIGIIHILNINQTALTLIFFLWIWLYLFGSIEVCDHK